MRSPNHTTDVTQFTSKKCSGSLSDHICRMLFVYRTTWFMNNHQHCHYPVAYSLHTLLLLFVILLREWEGKRRSRSSTSGSQQIEEHVDYDSRESIQYLVNISTTASSFYLDFLFFSSTSHFPVLYSTYDHRAQLGTRTD